VKMDLGKKRFQLQRREMDGHGDRRTSSGHRSFDETEGKDPEEGGGYTEGKGRVRQTFKGQGTKKSENL